MVRLGLVLVMVASVAALREIEFKNCKTTTGTLSCKVKNVRIEGCLAPSSWVDVDGSVVEYEEGNEKSPCRLNPNTNLNLSITFEPGFSMETVRSQVTLPDLPSCWTVQDVSQCPLDISPQAGCEHTKCPLQPGRQQRYETSVTVNREVAARTVNDRKIYQMRWKLWNNKDKKHSCCFNIPLQY